MIFTERKITIRNGKSTINEPVVLYRGDYEVSIKFTIMESKFRFKSGANLVDSEKASHGQLAILAPYGGNVFSEIVKCEDGTVTFTLTKEMIDQLEEVGLYSFQIRLFDYYRESRVSIPPVEFGIEVREPVASEDHDNEVNNAIVGYSIAKIADALNEKVPDTFNSNGDYNKTIWETGDRITERKLNKIEDAIDKINQNEINDKNTLNKQMTSNFNVLQSQIDNMVIESGNTDAEVEQARGEYNLLNQRLNAMDETDYELNSRLEHKINKEDLTYINVKNPPEGYKSAKGDGVTDDTDAIQELLNSFTCLEFPPGTYCISKTLNISSRQRIRGVGHGRTEDNKFSTIKAIQSMDSIFDVYGSDEAKFSLSISGFMLHCNDLANYGVKCGSLTNGSKIENIGIRQALNTGLYLTRSWYASFENFFIQNCPIGVYLDVAGTGDDSIEGINGISFRNFFMSCDQNVYANGTGHSIMFDTCTFERATSSSVLIENAYGSIVFNNCYWEASSSHDLEVTPRFEKIGCVTMINCYITQNTTPQVESIMVGNLDTFNIIGGFIATTSKTNDYLITTKAVQNYLLGTLRGANLKVGCVNATGHVVGINGKSYNQAERDYTQTKVIANSMQAVSRYGYNKETPGFIEVGSTMPENVDNGNYYRYGVKTTGGSDKLMIFYAVPRNGSTRGEDTTFMTVSQRLVVHPNRLACKAISSTQRPSNPVTGEVYFDTTIKKPIWYTGAKWVDANGNDV